MAGVAIFVAAGFAAVLAWVLARMLAARSRALDEVCSSLRKVHTAPTPRVGGVAVALGLTGGAAVYLAMTGQPAKWLVLLACVAPAFVWGLIEDLSQRGDVLPRLVLPAVAAALGFILLDARLTELHVPGLDRALAVHGVAFVVTLFAVTGVTHSINVIDGLNGLATMTGLLGAVGLAIVAAAVGDTFVLAVAAIVAGSLAGFLVVNYPSGRIFLGDGGAYLIGLLLAELSVLLVHRNSEVSPWFPLLLLAYPIWETLFSMYRRRSRGHSSAHADALHLHSLIFRRLVRADGAAVSAADTMARNSLASFILWSVPAACMVVAVSSWNSTLPLQIAAGTFILAYVFAYRRLVRFSVPAWMIVRAPSTRVAAEAADDVASVSR